jgi:hypothetical protein
MTIRSFNLVCRVPCICQIRWTYIVVKLGVPHLEMPAEVRSVHPMFMGPIAPFKQKHQQNDGGCRYIMIYCEKHCSISHHFFKQFSLNPHLCWAQILRYMSATELRGPILPRHLCLVEAPEPLWTSRGGHKISASRCRKGMMMDIYGNLWKYTQGIIRVTILKWLYKL